MGDPRNIAHAKKVTQEKHHKGAIARAHQSGKKTPPRNKGQAVAEESTAIKSDQAAKPGQKPDAAQLEKSLAILAKLKELEFHSRANIEKLAELSLAIEEELKQKAFVEPIGALYSAQDTFQSKIVALIADYETECQRLRPAG